MAMLPLRKRPAYAALAEHHAKLEGRHLRDLFDDDPNRGARLCPEAAGLYLDYSKNRITDETLDLLLQLAEQSDLEHRRDMMFAGVIFSEELGDAVLRVVEVQPRRLGAQPFAPGGVLVEQFPQMAAPYLGVMLGQGRVGRALPQRQHCHVVSPLSCA